MKDVKKTMIKTISKLKGHYSFVAMFKSGQMAAARFHEPLVAGIGRDSLFLASDVLGFIEYTDNVIYIDNGNFVVIENKEIQILDFGGNVVKHEITKVSKEFADVYKGDYAHFTLKEIYEQGQTILRAGENSSREIERAALYIREAKNIFITGSGTSYNSALIAKQVLSKFAKIKTESIIASEIQFSTYSIEANSILIAISQSGESADVLEAVNIAKQKNCKIISIVNFHTSSLARESDVVIGMNCGPEIGVAATKSFTSQLVILYKIVEKINSFEFPIISKGFQTQFQKCLKTHQECNKLPDT